MNEARRLFNLMVEPALAEWQGNLASERHARIVAESLNNMAEWVFHHVTKEGHSKPGQFRAAMAENHPEFRIVIDVANGTKHVELTDSRRKVTRADQTGIDRYEFVDDVKNFDGIVNVDELTAWFVNLDDGSREDLYYAVVKSLEMWENFLSDKGV